MVGDGVGGTAVAVAVGSLTGSRVGVLAGAMGSAVAVVFAAEADDDAALCSTRIGIGAGHQQQNPHHEQVENDMTNSTFS
jgi:hypothetical protein